MTKKSNRKGEDGRENDIVSSALRAALALIPAVGGISIFYGASLSLLYTIRENIYVPAGEIYSTPRAVLLMISFSFIFVMVASLSFMYTHLPFILIEYKPHKVWWRHLRRIRRNRSKGYPLFPKILCNIDQLIISFISIFFILVITLLFVANWSLIFGGNSFLAVTTILLFLAEGMFINSSVYGRRIKNTWALLIGITTIMIFLSATLALNKTLSYTAMRMIGVRSSLSDGILLSDSAISDIRELSARLGIEFAYCRLGSLGWTVGGIATWANVGSTSYLQMSSRQEDNHPLPIESSGVRIIRGIASETETPVERLCGGRLAHFPG